MSALEILRETTRILRHRSGPFLLTLFVLICPVSASLLSTPFLTGRLTRFLARLAVTTSLPPTLCRYLAKTLLSSASSFPLLLAARSAVAYSIACNYARSPVLASDFLGFLRIVRCRFAFTYLCACGLVLLTAAFFFTLLVTISTSLVSFGYPQHLLIYFSLLIILCFAVAYAHLIVVCNLAGVVSMLEERSGAEALRRSLWLIDGRVNIALLMFLGSTVGMGLVEWLFDHRVKSLSYGDGSSRIWEGPLLVLMHSFVVLVDFMMSAVFYYSCRSSGLDELDGDVDLKTTFSSDEDSN